MAMVMSVFVDTLILQSHYNHNLEQHDKTVQDQVNKQKKDRLRNKSWANKS